MKKVFTTGQVAKFCNVAPRTVSKWFDSGRLKGYRIPGSQDRRVPREQLLRFLKEHGLPLGGLEDAWQFKVLLIGAAAPLVDRLRDLLPGADGFRLEAAPSVFAAGGLVRELAPDAVVIDLALGRADAVAIATSLRRTEALASVPVLALASEDETDPAELVGAGFTEVHKKPFDPGAVASALADYQANRDAPVYRPVKVSERKTPARPAPAAKTPFDDARDRIRASTDLPALAAVWESLGGSTVLQKALAPEKEKRKAELRGAVKA